MAYRIVTQDACSHDAKVKMAGYKDMYECTRCHRFIPTITPKEKENRDMNNTALERFHEPICFNLVNYDEKVMPYIHYLGMP